MRDKIFDIIEGNSESLISRLVTGAVFLTILVSCVGFVLESIPELHEQYHREFYILDVVVVMIFTLEYAIRFITARKKWEHIWQPFNIIDILSILPFYLDLLLSSVVSLRILRLIRLVRIFRIFKLAKYSESLTVTTNAFRDARPALASLVVLMGMVLVLFSSAMHYAEHDAHISYCHHKNTNGTICHGRWVEGTNSPDKPACPVCQTKIALPVGEAAMANHFRSIVSTFWWCIATMTTVGYGDVVPQTALGKIIAGLTMIVGILAIALPTGIMATAFSARLEESRKNTLEKKAHNNLNHGMTCPHCQHKFAAPASAGEGRASGVG